MKKIALFLLLVISFSCLGNTQGQAATCPSERPLLIGGTWKNKNCPKFTIHHFHELRLIQVPKWEELPNFLCPSDYEKEENKVFCQKLKEIPKEISELKNKKEWSAEKRRTFENNVMNYVLEICLNNILDCSKLNELAEKLGDVNIHISQLEDSIQKHNSELVELNGIIKEKNDLLKEKKEVISEYYDKCEIKEYRFPFFTPSGYVHIFHHPIMDLQEYEKSVERTIKERLKQIEYPRSCNQDRIDENLSDILYVMKNEKENDITISEFEKFYTPEKEKQLSEELEKALSEKCVPCDIPEPLDTEPGDCYLCPNREYVNSKCILKQNRHPEQSKGSQEINKGVKK